MGKRKVTRKAVKKEKEKLDTVFNCLFCNHEKSVTVKMDNEHKVGFIRCGVCPATYQTPINYLSAPIDVYCDWIDACEEANTKKRRVAGPPESRRRPSRSSPPRSQPVDRFGVPDELDDVEEY
ncbi:hypothetical protein IWQ61_007130 [Dispira simplex]|nr:hypothetical protein IWQ61_007130 [Dispira simplex]